MNILNDNNTELKHWMLAFCFKHFVWFIIGKLVLFNKDKKKNAPGALAG